MTKFFPWICLLAAPLWADLPQAERLIERRCYSLAERELNRSENEDPLRARLLRAWLWGASLRREAALPLLEGQPRGRLYWLARSSLEAEPRQALQQALLSSSTPAEKVQVLLALYRNTPFPEDQEHWEKAARLAADSQLDPSWLAELSLTHVTYLTALKRGQEAWSDLALASPLLRSIPGGPSRLAMARAQLLEALGQAAEAERERWEAFRRNPDKLGQLRFLRGLTQQRADLSPERAKKILSALAQVEVGLESPEARLLAFRIRSAVAFETGLGEHEFLAKAQLLSQSPKPRWRLLACCERAEYWMRRGQSKRGQAELERALSLAQSMPASPDRELFGSTEPAPLAVTLSSSALARADFGEAERLARIGLGDRDPARWNTRVTAYNLLLTIYSRTARVEEAQRVVRLHLSELKASQDPTHRAVGYVTIFNSLLLSHLNETTLFEVGPIRVNADAPSGWIFRQIFDDPVAGEEALQAFEDWRASAPSPNVAANAWLCQAAVLGALNRPLDAIEAYRRGLAVAGLPSSVRANLVLLLAHELVGLGRRQEALEAMRSAYHHHFEVGYEGLRSRYRLALIGLLAQQGESEEALRLASLEEDAASLYWQGRLTQKTTLLERALAQAEGEEFRDVIRLELHRPSEVKGRGLNTTLRLARYFQTRNQTDLALQALELGWQSFSETFQQLPAQAQPLAGQSPTLAACLEMASELELAQGHSERAALWLNRLHSVQSRPPLTSPEVEELRAELTGLQQSRDPALEQRLASTKEQFLVALNQLRQRQPEVESALSAQGRELLAVQPHLEADTMLVQYYLAPESIYIQAVTAKEQRLHRVMVERSRVQEVLHREQARLAQPAASGQRDFDSNLLYQWLVEPLGPLPKQLLVMPTGPFWGLPMETLTGPGGRRLTEDCRISYLAASDWLLLTRPAPEAPLGNWLALSNQELPSTQTELARISAIAPSLQAFQESWTDFRRKAASAQVLHLATHSVARPERVNDSFFQLGQEKVTLAQVYQLPLAPGSLVCLSSCSGGVGQSRAQRDLLSLASGFRAAGASTVVSALWNVDDEACAEFFPAFYASLLSGASRSEALQQAKLKLLNSSQWRDPYFWGAFTLVGDPR